MGLWHSSEATVVPALLRCDGHYHRIDARDAGAATSTLAWCGWLRFEGNGGTILKCGEERVEQTRGEWSVRASDAVSVALPADAPERLIFVREGPAVDTVIVSADASEEAPGVLFGFVPEEELPG